MRKKKDEEQTDDKTISINVLENYAKSKLDDGYYSTKRKRQCIGSCVILVVLYCVLLLLDFCFPKIFLAFQPFMKLLAPTAAAVSGVFDWEIRNMNNTLDVMLSKDAADAIKKTDVYKDKLSFSELMRALLVVVAFMLAVLGLV